MNDKEKEHLELSALRRALLAKEMGARKDIDQIWSLEPIAVVGMACRFPGANNLNAFWELLENGRDAITEVPPDRWDASALYDPDPSAPGKMITRWGGFLDRVDRFDACVPGGEPNTPPLVQEFRRTFAGPMIAISSFSFYRRELIRAGCDHECEKDSLPKKLVEVLGL